MRLRWQISNFKCFTAATHPSYFIYRDWEDGTTTLIWPPGCGIPPVAWHEKSEKTWDRNIEGSSHCTKVKSITYSKLTQAPVCMQYIYIWAPWVTGSMVSYRTDQERAQRDKTSGIPKTNLHEDNWTESSSNLHSVLHPKGLALCLCTEILWLSSKPGCHMSHKMGI